MTAPRHSGNAAMAFRHAVAEPAANSPAGVLFLLHGTGGDETSLLELGRAVAPNHVLIGVRGRSDEEGVTRFFRRFDALRYDQAHLASEADALATFTLRAAEHYLAADMPRAALGYSNGANVALAAELRAPGTFQRMALLRPVQPFTTPPAPDLTGLAALLLFGAADPYLQAGQSLPALLASLGATVEHAVLPAGHALNREDLVRARAWFAGVSA
ncbi:MAG: alpha/beta hydrolase [Deinococcales bacterium]